MPYWQSIKGARSIFQERKVERAPFKFEERKLECAPILKERAPNELRKI